MGFMEERIAKEIVRKVGKQLGEKFHNEFWKIEAEFKRMAKAINEIEKRVDKIEKKLHNAT